jgi:hypothetical protein
MIDSCRDIVNDSNKQPAIGALVRASGRFSSRTAGIRRPVLGNDLLVGSHSSTTDPDARLFRKGKGKQAKLCHKGHAMTFR